MRIAIADMDLASVGFLRDVVQDMGHSASIFHSSPPLMLHLQRDTYDLLILGRAMFDGLGHDIVKWVHHNLSIPPAILMMTDGAAKADIAAALHAGADDYIVKPEDRGVVEARITALLRRGAGRKAMDGNVQIFGRYGFDQKNQAASLDGYDIALTAKEFALALLFFQNEQRPLSRSYLLDAIWNSVAELPSRTLDMHVSRIRAKLRLTPENGFRLFTVFGYGYRLERFEGD